MSNAPDPDSKAPPFAKHRVYYIALKWIVIALAAAIAVRFLAGFFA